MSFLFAPRRGYGVIPPRRAPRRSRRPQTANPHAEIQRKTSRPLGTNTPAAVRAPRLSGAEKEPPVRGEPADAVRAPRSAGAGKGAARKGRTRLRQFECPAGSVQKRSRPSGANTLTQFAHPGFPVQKRSRPVRANPPAAVRVPRWVDAENPGNPEKIFPPEKAAKTPILTLRKRLSERYS